MTTINITKDSAKEWVSDVIVMNKPSIAMHITFEDNPGSVVVERSISGAGWVTAGVVCGIMNESRHVEFGITGAVAGQKVRIVTNKECKIEYI